MNEPTWNIFFRAPNVPPVATITAPTKEEAERIAFERFGQPMNVNLVRIPNADGMSPLWNLFSTGGCGGHRGTCDGETKEEVERVAREELGMEVDADLVRPTPDIPESEGWWNDFSEDD